MNNLVKPALAFLLVALVATAGTGHAQITFRAAASAALASSTGTVTFVGSVTAVGQGTSAALTLPAAAQTGDVVIAVVAVEDETNATVTKPGTFTLIRGDNAGDHTQIVSYRVIAGTDVPGTTTYAWSWTGTEDYSAALLVFRGVDATTPVDANNGTATNATNTGTISIPAITPTVANTLLVAAASIRSQSTFATWSGGLTERTDARSANAADEIAVGTATVAGPAATVSSGTFTVVASTADTSRVGALLALRPANLPLTINVPTGTAIGDVMVAAIAVTGSGATISTPTGWVLQTTTVQGAVNASRQAVFTRVVTGAEPASYSWTFSAAHTGAVGGIATYSGVDNSTPVDDSSGNTTPVVGDTTLQHRATGVTTTVPDTLVISTHSFSSSSTWTPTGMTERVDLNSGGGTGGISLAINDAAQALAGATGNKLATAAANGDSGVAQILVLRPNALGPVLEWTMDQILWNSTPGEVADASGNGLNGRAFNGAATAIPNRAIPTNPGSCRYGTFDGNDDYLEVADNALLDITDELTVMAWLRPTAYPATELKSWMSKDQNYEAHLRPTGVVNWWWGGGTGLELDSVSAVPLNTWTHVTLVYSRAGGFQRIYLNGVLNASGVNANVALVPNAMPFQVAADQNFAGRFFPGSIDEVRVFRQALGPGRILQYMNTTRACLALLDHYSISHAGSGVACDTQTITITAHDSNHAAVSVGGTTIDLSTTNAKGTWVGISAGGGTLTDTTAGDGAATYQFATGSSSVQLLFRYANLAAASETFGFNASSGAFSEASGAATVAEDPAFTMALAGFQFRNATNGNTTIPTQISGKPSDTGWNAKAIQIRAINTDLGTGACTGLFTGIRNVDLGAECNSPATCASRQVSINGTNISTSNNNGGIGAAGYTSVPLTFNASAEAVAVIAYPDAGEISLHARYDIDPSIAGHEALGSSNLFVVRPFGFAFPGIAHSITAAGTVIAAAGDNFPMTVTAYQWAAGEDVGGDGIPDPGSNISNNGTVPNFAATVTVAPGANLPGVALGAVSRGATCGSAGTVAVTGGTASPADWCYSEVGNVFLTATTNGYITAGVDITGDSGLDGTGTAGGYVGRFRPKNFALSGTPTLLNRSASSPVCSPASSFTYMGEGLSLGFTLIAQNTQGVTTQNYSGTYAKLAIGTFSNFAIGARSGTTNLISRVDNSVSPTGSWTNGSASVTAVTGITRLASADGPYSAVQFGIAPLDSDAVAMGTFNFDADINSVNERVRLGLVTDVTEVRFGRLRLGNAFGSSLLDLPIPLSTEYFTGSVFTTNTADSCTTLAASNIRISPASTPDLATTCVTKWNPTGAIYFNAGKASAVAPPAAVSPVKLTKPGAGNSGSVDLTVDLTGPAAGNTCTPASSPVITANKPWLLGNWGTTTYTADPSGRATFGLFKSADEFIYLREMY